MEKYRKVCSPHDGLELDILEVLPDDGKVRGIVQIVHGMQEHKERYRPFMEYLAHRGYAAVAGDHRGHGGSVRNKKDFGYFYDESGQAIVDDLETVNSSLRLQYPHVPLFMVGHSMGTLIARKYLKDHDEDLSGLILSGPVYENPGASAGRKLIDIVTAYRGGHYISKKITRMVEGSFDTAFPGTEKNRWLSRNAENVRAFNDDPLCGNPFTLNGYKNLMILIQDVYSPEGWKVKNPDIPILFAAGDEDVVIGSPQEFAAMQKFMEDRGYRHVTGKLYPRMRHEILNEVNRETVFEDFYNFMQEHSSVKPADRAGSARLAASGVRKKEGRISSLHTRLGKRNRNRKRGRKK